MKYKCRFRCRNTKTIAANWSGSSIINSDLCSHVPKTPNASNLRERNRAFSYPVTCTLNENKGTCADEPTLFLITVSNTRVFIFLDTFSFTLCKERQSCYQPVQNLSSFRLFSKNVKIRIYILPAISIWL
jgi:hypothetical protein